MSSIPYLLHARPMALGVVTEIDLWPMWATHQLFRSMAAHVRARLLAGERVEQRIIRKLRPPGLWPYRTSRPGIENPDECLSDHDRLVKQLEVLSARWENGGSD